MSCVMRYHLDWGEVVLQGGYCTKLLLDKDNAIHGVGSCVGSCLLSACCRGKKICGYVGLSR